MSAPRLYCLLCGDPIQPLRDGWAHWPGLGGSCPGPRPELDPERLDLRCEVCGHRVTLAIPGDVESFVHAEDGDWGDHTAEASLPF